MRLAVLVLVLVLVALAVAASPALAQPSTTPVVVYGPPYAQPASPVAAAPVPIAQPQGVYFTESFGGTRFGGDHGRHAGSGLRIRAALGYRHKHLAFELWAGGVIGLHSHDQHRGEHTSYLSLDLDRPSHGDHHPTSGVGGMAMWGFDVKYLHPLSRHVEVYARGGLGRGYTEVSSGRGLGLGAGAQLKGKVPAIGFLFWPLFFTGLGPKVTAALYIETGYELYRLHGPRATADVGLHNMIVGFAVGSEF